MTSPAPLPATPPPDDPLGTRDAEPLGPMTLEEYLTFEEAAEDRHEYVGGMVYAMSGGTARHHRISFNVASRLQQAARGTACRVYHQGFKIRTPRGNAYYPDAMVACGPRPTGDALYLEDPCLLVEVLSPSTQRTDTGEKLLQYQEIPSVQAYWVVEARWRCVHRHWRDADGRWQFEDVTGDGVLAVPCLPDASATLDEVYEDFEVPREPPRPYLRRVREPSPAYAG